MIRTSLPAIATIAVAIAACSGPGSEPLSSAAATRVPSAYASPGIVARPAHEQRGWILPTATIERRVYVADGDQVLIFPEKHNPPPIGKITDGIDYAYGLWVDRYGNLYVANEANDTVTQYAAGATTPSQTYTADLERPLYPVVDSHGNLWVGNAGNGTVVEYEAGYNTVKQVLQTAGVEADGLDFDTQGNLYVAYRSAPQGTGSVEEFPAGSSQGTILGMTLNQPQGVVVTASGTILTAETGGTNRIDVFPPGYTIPTLEVGVKDVPTQLAITNRERALFVSSLANKVYVSPYPLLNPNGSPNKMHEKINARRYGMAQGMALSNGQVF